MYKRFNSKELKAMAVTKRPAHDVMLDFLEDNIKNKPALTGEVSAQQAYYTAIKMLLEILQTMFLLQTERQKVLFALREFQQDLDCDDPVQDILQKTIIELIDEVQ